MCARDCGWKTIFRLKYNAVLIFDKQDSFEIGFESGLNMT